MRPLIVAVLLLAPNLARAQATSTTRATDQTDLNRTPNAPAQGAAKGEEQVDDPSLANKAGLKKRVITPLLQSAVDRPYSRAGLTTCPRIAAAVTALDGELGPDVNERQGRRDSQAGYYVKRTSEFLLGPVYLARDIFREAGGERRAQDRFAAAVEAAAVRRGFLKGLGAAKGCTPPAAPSR